MKDVVNQYLDQYPNLSEGADRVGGQLRRDKECPFSGVTKSGRVWRKVPESGARSVLHNHCLLFFADLVPASHWGHCGGGNGGPAFVAENAEL